jgi:P-type Cu+ transporter
MTANQATTAHRAEHAGHQYFFCSAKCRERFVADPARYIAPDQILQEPAIPAHVPGQTLWTCPMHPQIVRSEPGFCPICGMTLEPMTPAGTEAVNPELRDMTHRF